MQLVRGISEYEIEGIGQLYRATLRPGKPNAGDLRICSVHDIAILRAERGDEPGDPEYIALSPFENKLLVYPRPMRRVHCEIEYWPSRRTM